MISRENKQKVIADMQTAKNDNGSPVVQVGILTARITELTGHLKVNKKDHAARRGLLQMVGRRKKLLRYISEKDTNTYLKTIEKLGLRR
ncbi:30S ribosomal protein S15 [Candidatus Saccharibacteria bacterium]|nr:30S ribosomal protein S15 [Candidatus Saccharibacteria bacterium]